MCWRTRPWPLSPPAGWPVLAVTALSVEQSAVLAAGTAVCCAAVGCSPGTRCTAGCRCAGPPAPAPVSTSRSAPSWQRLTVPLSQCQLLNSPQYADSPPGPEDASTHPVYPALATLRLLSLQQTRPGDWARLAGARTGLADRLTALLERDTEAGQQLAAVQLILAHTGHQEDKVGIIGSMP